MHSDGSEESTTLCIEASNSWVFMHLELESGELFSLILIVREDWDYSPVCSHYSCATKNSQWKPK